MNSAITRRSVTGSESHCVGWADYYRTHDGSRFPQRYADNALFFELNELLARANRMIQ
jgi:hypothetical protein